jgi:hypothetical protein
MKRRTVILALAASAALSASSDNLGRAQEAAITLSTGISPEQKTLVIDAERQEKMAKARAKMAEAHAKMAAKAADFNLQQIFVGGHHQGADADIRAAAEKVHAAEDEATKAEATEKLTGLLDKYFEDDMQARNKELEKIAARLTKLREQLDRRRTKKQEIIGLQVKVVLNEAEGLGFYSSPNGYGTYGSTFRGPGEFRFGNFGDEAFTPPVPVEPATPAAPKPAPAPSAVGVPTFGVEQPAATVPQ